MINFNIYSRCIPHDELKQDFFAGQKCLLAQTSDTNISTVLLDRIIKRSAEEGVDNNNNNLISYDNTILANKLLDALKYYRLIT